MSINFKKQSINSVRWTLVDKAGSQVLLLINIFVLGRILDPKDYGLVSMLYIFMSLSGLFIDSGMGAGLIRKQGLTQRDCTTIFYFNMGVASICYFLMFIGAPYVAKFYNEPVLTNLLRVLGLNLVITSSGQIHSTLLMKDLNVKKVTRSSLIGMFISTIIAITCAYKGFGVWSLVILNMVQSVISVFLLWKFSGWRPSREFSTESFKEFYSFGIGLFMASFVELIFKNFYQPFIAKMFSASYTGFYYQARRLNEVPISILSSVVNSITFPILVRYQDDIPKLTTTYEKIIKLLIFITLPVVILLYLLSHSIVMIIMGEKWIYSAELLQILSMAGIFMVLENINRNLLKLEGRTKLIFKLEVVKKIIVVVTILATYRFGIKALMYGIVFNAMSSFVLNQSFTIIKIKDYRKIFQILLNGVIMAAVTYFSILYLKNNYLILGIGSFVGISTYLLLAYFMRLEEQKWALSIVSNKFK